MVGAIQGLYRNKKMMRLRDIITLCSYIEQQNFNLFWQDFKVKITLSKEVIMNGFEISQFKTCT